MTTFTINDENAIVAFTTTEEAVLADPTAISFDSQDALAAVSADWPLARFVEIFNSIPGNAPVKKFADRSKAIARIWRAIQPLAGNVEPSEAVEEPVEVPDTVAETDEPATGDAESAELAAGSELATQAIEPAADAPAESAANPKAKKERKAATKSATPAKKAKTPTKTADKPASDRSNKKAEVIALMRRSRGVTLAEIAELTNWQKHTIRGFVSILGSKGGEKIESSKNAAGERCYKIAK